jgi:hypothetical protein
MGMTSPGGYFTPEPAIRALYFRHLVSQLPSHRMNSKSGISGDLHPRNLLKQVARRAQHALACFQ